jgi:hypothetical protein
MAVAAKDKRRKQQKDSLVATWQGFLVTRAKGEEASRAVPRAQFEAPSFYFHYRIDPRAKGEEASPAVPRARFESPSFYSHYRRSVSSSTKSTIRSTETAQDRSTALPARYMGAHLPIYQVYTNSLNIITIVKKTHFNLNSEQKQYYRTVGYVYV